MVEKDDLQWLTEMGLCHRCRKEKTAPGRKFCFDCLDKEREAGRKRYNPEKARKYQERRREIYREKKEKGICIRCSKKATHGMYCYECSIKERRRSMQRAEYEKNKRHERGLIPEQRKAEGLCLWCGEPAVEGMQCCSTHREIFRKAGEKGFIANLINKNNPWVNERVAWRKKRGRPDYRITEIRW